MHIIKIWISSFSSSPFFFLQEAKQITKKIINAQEKKIIDEIKQGLLNFQTIFSLKVDEIEEPVANTQDKTDPIVENNVNDVEKPVANTQDKTDPIVENNVNDVEEPVANTQDKTDPIVENKDNDVEEPVANTQDKTDETNETPFELPTQTAQNDEEKQPKPAVPEEKKDTLVKTLKKQLEDYQQQRTNRFKVKDIFAP